MLGVDWCGKELRMEWRLCEKSTIESAEVGGKSKKTMVGGGDRGAGEDGGGVGVVMGVEKEGERWEEARVRLMR